MSSSSSSAVGAGKWYFLLRVLACATGVVHVEAMPSVGRGIRGVSGADVMLANGPVWSSGGPDVNQMDWYCLRARVVSCIIIL